MRVGVAVAAAVGAEAVVKVGVAEVADVGGTI